MLDLTISIVNYHNEEDIRTMVATIEQYTPREITKKIYLIDNGDSTALTEIAKPYGDVTVIKSPGNIGFGRGHNQVLAQLDSRYHAIVNPDIVLTEDAFTPLLQYMDTHPLTGMTIPRILDDEGKLMSVYRKDPTVGDMILRRLPGMKKRKAAHTLQDEDYTKPFEVPFAQGSFLVVRTKLYREIGGFDERYFLYMEDADLCRTIRAKAKIEYVPYASVIHHWEQASGKSIKFLRIHLHSTRQYLQKCGWRLL